MPMEWTVVSVVIALVGLVAALAKFETYTHKTEYSEV